MIESADIERLAAEMIGREGFDPKLWLERSGIETDAIVTTVAAALGALERGNNLVSVMSSLFAVGFEAGKEYGKFAEPPKPRA